MAKSATHCLTELFPIYQNKYWTIRWQDDHTIVPSSHHIILKIVGFFYLTWGYITLALGSGQVDNADLLSKVVKNFFSNREKTTDRRKYKGKHKNSPMVIKFL
jgi:hypothetical protein